MRALTSIRTPYLFVLTAATLLNLAACSAEAGTGPATTTASGEVAEAVTTPDPATTTTASKGHPHEGHPGPDFLIFAALHEPINLTADQEKTIRALLPSDQGGPHGFDKARAATLAAGIRAGNVDVSASSPREDDFTTRRAALSSALTTLHATLTAPQRRALVDAVARKDAERASSDQGGRHEGPGGHGDGRGPMEHLTEGLDLTAAQRTDLDAKLAAARRAPPSESDRAAWKAQHEGMRAAMQAKLETFAGESFDATSFVAPPAGAKKPDDHVDHFAKDLAILTAVLDSAQREKLAQRIEAGPPAHTPPAP